MNPAIIDQTSVDIKAGDYTFRATGSVVKFPGFMAVYMEEKPEDQAPSEDENGEAVLPPLTEGEVLTLIKLDPKQHFTQPPPRFSEALLVKTLEEKGIGRPSTYAAIISTIQDRDYVNKVENKFRPTELGVLVNELLVNHFPVVMDVAFTARMEEELDKIEEGTDALGRRGQGLLQTLQREPREGPGRDEGLQGRTGPHRHHLRKMRQAHDHQVGQERPVPRLQRLSGLQEHEALRAHRERRSRGRARGDHGRALPQVRLPHGRQTGTVRKVPRLLALSRSATTPRACQRA